MSVALDVRVVPLLEQLRTIFAEQAANAKQRRKDRKAMACCVCRKTGDTTREIAWFGEDRPMCSMHCGIWNADFRRYFSGKARIDDDMVELQFAQFLINRLKNGR